MCTSEAVTKLLRLAACIAPDTAHLGRLEKAARAVDKWAEVVNRAEEHGLAPLLWRHLSSCGVVLDESVQQQLRALTVRHRRANEIRAEALIEIVDLYAAHGIECVVLKGGALAYVLYPQPHLRPMRDLDVLVDAGRADSAQRLLREIGYKAPLEHANPMMRYHHHLPIASGEKHGLRLSVEVHLDALSGDYPQSLRLQSLERPLQEFDIAGIRVQTLCHEDMLHHLCRHAFEPAAAIRLISVADIIGYANRFHDVIDWGRLDRELPFVANAISLLHYVTPLPAALARLRPAEDQRLPERVGEGFVPISEMLSSGRPAGQFLKDALFPSPWWLHAYYGAAPGTSTMYVRWTRHGPRLARWGIRRLRAMLSNALHKPSSGCPSGGARRRAAATETIDE